MASTTTTTSLDSKPAIKRPVAQRNDSSIETHDSFIKRRPRVIEKRSCNDNHNNNKTKTSDKDLTNPQQQSRLFRLPYELRLMIYEFALPTPAIPTLFSSSSPFEDFGNGSSSSSSTISSPPPSSHDIINDPATEPPFLQTCRLARLEGLPIFYRHNDFLLNRRPSLDFQHPLLMSMMTPTALLSRNKKSKSKKGGNNNNNNTSSKWLYAMSDSKITKIQSVVFAQLGRGMYKETSSGNEWRRDASACFRVRLLTTIQGGTRKSKGKDYEIDYLKIDETGKSDRYAERLVKALETRMEQLTEKGVREWSRQDIWDLAYLL